MDCNMFEEKNSGQKGRKVDGENIYKIRIVQLIVLFWTLYFSFVAVTNLIDGLQTIKLVSKSWKFTSGNFNLIAEKVSIYGTPIWVVAILFFGIIIWGSFNTILLWRAFFNIQKKTYEPPLFQAFFTSIGYFVALTIASELFLIYEFTDKYIMIVTSLLVSLYVCHRFLDEMKRTTP